MARDKKMTLTEKQRRFIDEYLIDLNATAAAKRAGYSEKNADKIGPQLLGKTRIAQELAGRLKKRQERTEITQDWVIEKLKDLAVRSSECDDAPHMQVAAKTLELLGRHLGMYTDKMTLKGELTVSSVLEELKRRG